MFYFHLNSPLYNISDTDSDFTCSPFLKEKTAKLFLKIRSDFHFPNAETRIREEGFFGGNGCSPGTSAKKG